MEVIVAGAMMGVISLGVMQLTQNANKTSKAVGQQIEMLDLQVSLKRALSNQAGCTASLAGVNVGGAGPNLGTGVDINNIFRADGVTTAITRNQRYGFGSGAVIVTDIEAIRWLDSGQPAINNRRFGSVQVAFEVTKGNASASDASHATSSYGTRRVVKFSDVISVSIDDGTNQITSCYQDQNQFVTAACNAMGGQFNTLRGLCENIQIQNSSTNGVGNLDANGARQFAIIARSAIPNAAGNDEGSIKADGGIVIGDPFGDKPATLPTTGGIGDTNGPGIGNAVIGNSVTVVDATDGAVDDLASDIGEGAALVQGGFRVGYIPVAGIKPPLVDGDGHFAGSLTAMSGLSVGMIKPPALAAGDAIVTSQMTLGTGGIPTPGEAFRSVGGSLHSLNGRSAVHMNANGNTNSSIDLNGNNAFPLQLRELGNVRFQVGEDGSIQTSQGTGADLRFQVSSTGQIDVFRSGSGNPPRLSLATGAAGALYRPSLIYNQPRYSGNLGIAGQEMEITTKEWVLGAIYHALSDSFDYTNLLTGLSETIQDSPFEAVAAAICDNFRVRNQATGGFTAGSWSGGNCNVTSFVCGDSTGQRCATHYATNYNATGSISATGNLNVSGTSNLRGNVRISQNGGNLIVYRVATFNSTITASGQIRSLARTRGANIYGDTRVYGGGGGVSNGICGIAGCATRFGNQRCVGGVVIGIANGRLICGKPGGGGINPTYGP